MAVFPIKDTIKTVFVPSPTYPTYPTYPTNPDISNK